MKAKFMFNLAVMVCILLGSFGAVPAASQPVQTSEASSADVPGWPMPDKPIPHHEPGHLSGALSYTSQVEVPDASGALQPQTVSGLDAYAADGRDPLSGNYTVVGWDKLQRSSAYGMETFSSSGTLENPTGTFTPLPGSAMNIGNNIENDIAAGDLNGDGQAEQITAWLDATDRSLILSSGEMPGDIGKVTSAPAAVARSITPTPGYALSFDGGNDYVSVPNKASLNPAQITVGVMAKSAGPAWSATASMVSKREAYIMHPEAGNRNVEFFVYVYVGVNGAWVPANFHAPENFDITAWHQYVGTYDGARVRLYVDGALVGETAYTGNLKTNDTGVLLIGKDDAPGGFFEGEIDDVRIWNRALSQVEIQAALYAPGAVPAGLAASWQFEEGIGTTAVDSSPNGNTGALIHDPAWVGVESPLAEIELFVRGYDYGLWHCKYYEGMRGCYQWDNNAGGGILLSAPTIVSKTADEFDVYAILNKPVDIAGVMSNVPLVYRRSWSPAGWSAAWEQLDDETYWLPLASLTPLPELAAPAVVGNGSQVDLFRRGDDNTLRWCHYTGSTCAWQSLGGMLSSAPSALKTASGLQVFARGFDEALWTRIYIGTYPDGVWQGWQRWVVSGMTEGVTMASTPAVVSPSAGQFDLYVRGSDYHLWKAHFDGSAWGGWSDEGGTLTSAPAVTMLGGQPYLFAQAGSGSLQVNRPGMSWESLLGGITSCCIQVDFNDLKGAASNRGLYADYSIDVETGYFWGDGRSQIVVGYRPTAAIHKVKLALFDISDSPQVKGFTPELITEFQLPDDADYFVINTGDYVGRDGIDDIAVAYVHDYTYTVDILQFDRQNGQLEEVTGLKNAFVADPSYGFAGSLNIASGDLDRDGQDEVVINLTWSRHEHNYGTWPDECDVNHYVFHTHIYDVLRDIGGLYSLPRYYVEAYYYHVANLDASTNSVALALAAGDVNGDGKDEIVRTWPYDFGQAYESCWLGDFPNSDQFQRRSQVISLPEHTAAKPVWTNGADGTINGKDVKDIVIFNNTEQAHADRLVVGDLDRDMTGEIVLQAGFYNNVQGLYAYKFDPGAVTAPYYKLIAGKYIGWGDLSHLAVGDFTGEGVRVGPPTYRVQERIDTMVSIINMPPKHRDYVKSDSGVYHLIVSPPDDQACEYDPYSSTCTHAAFIKKDGSTTEQKVESRRAFSVSAGMESKACAGAGIEGLGSLKACVTTSLNASYGANFSLTTDRIFEAYFTTKVPAYTDDKLVYYATPYEVWEYPILNGQTGVAQDYITVAFPSVKNTNAPNTADGNYTGICNEDWFAPGHQINNVWSYDAIGNLNFADYVPAGGDPNNDPNVVYIASHPGDAWVDISFGSITGKTTSAEYKHAISASVGTETSGSLKLKVVNLEGSFKANVKGSYEGSELTTDVNTSTANTTYTFALGAKPTEPFTTRVILYWSKFGYQIMNYQTQVGDGDPANDQGDWKLYYNKPDPAFILPWYDYPDQVTTNAPPCGVEKSLFSPEIQVNPPFASVGDIVEITATVRNFSNVSPSKPVVVKFYQGDPKAGGIYLGEDTINTQAESLTRQDPRTAHYAWTVSGSGKQKIYAVIDPKSDAPGVNFDEVHDEDDLIDNNTAYTHFEVGSAGLVDQGAVVEQPYAGQTFFQASGTEVSFYQPPDSLGAVSRMELRDSGQIIQNAVGNPFDLVAYQGTTDTDIRWDKPWPNFLLAQAGSPPAVMAIGYDGVNLGDINEADLKLYRKTNSGWEEANVTCGLGPDGQTYPVERFLEGNLIVVPVCRTGTFVLAAGMPEWPKIFVPLIRR